MSMPSNESGSPQDHTHSHPVGWQRRTPVAPWERKHYRNRHGRGQRQPMFGVRMPRYRTKSGAFDDLVASHIKRLRAAWPELFVNLQCAVEDVPPSDPLDWEEHKVPLSRAFPAGNGIPARIVLYSMPLQSRAASWSDLEFLVRDEIVFQLANLNGMHPEDIDPDWGM
ncbi:metallopeptidase family protein [Pseudoscardovia suis]|uniref:metallopeptidase family protein n=1 Tax=Pseudoscardovia suis TaxID=987063 RepID=UPI003F970507